MPFSARFDELTSTQRWVYAVVLGGAGATTGLVVAPVAFHRAMFRHHRRVLLVDQGNRFARLGLTALAATVSGVLFLCLDVALGRTAGQRGNGRRAAQRRRPTQELVRVAELAGELLVADG